MKINFLDVDSFIKRNKCVEITNSIFFNFGNIPTEDGLFSYEIFGQMGSDKRKETFAYIDLKKKFLHPVTYKIVTSMNRKLIQCINGTKYFSINNKGEIIEDPEKGQTGIKFLYDNWEKIKWTKTESFTRDDKVTILQKENKDKLFIDKILVIPPFIRDFQPTENNERIDKVEAINDMYAKIIRFCQSSDDFGFSFLSYTNDALVQDLLIEIYEFCTSQLARKTGMIHQALLGKSVDYATRSVISCPMVNSNTWEKTQLKFGYTGVPLSQVVALFYPFFVYEIQTWFENNLDSINDKLRQQNIQIKNIMEQFDEEHIKKIMLSYIKNHESRFDQLYLKADDGKNIPLKLYENDLGRPFTVTDLLYIVSQDVIQNKHVYVTRYPVTSFQSIYPSRIKVLTTQKTVEQRLGNKYFEEYPLILKEYPYKRNGVDVKDIFIDTVRVHNCYLTSLGADYDGDTISLRAVFTQEANAEAEELINSKSYYLDNNAKLTRVLKNEAIQALYSLTY